MTHRWLERVRGIRTWVRDGQRTPHKPLLLLWMLGRVQAGRTGPVTFTELEEPVRGLLRDFGPPRTSYHPEFPFHHLTSDGLWVITDATGADARALDTSVTRLRAAGAVDRLEPAFEDALVADPDLLGSIAHALLDANFPASLHDDLAARTGLALDPHPPRIHFTYLDPAHRAAGGRVHDSATVGDTVALPYAPQIVVISENKDTVIHFPPLPGGVSVEGVGRGGSTVAAFDWITAAPQVVNWGDMDADGLETLDGFRAAGVPATSILMDPAAYDAWEPFPTNVDQHGKPLGPRPARPVPHLTDAERTLYRQLIAPDWSRHRRVEPERIPLATALAEVRCIP